MDSATRAIRFGQEVLKDLRESEKIRRKEQELNAAAHANPTMPHGQVYVVIRRQGTNEIVNKMGPMSERVAERVIIGALFNLNRSEFTVGIEKAN